MMSTRKLIAGGASAALLLASIVAVAVQPFAQAADGSGPSITNTATATGTAPDGTPVTAQDTVTVNLANPAVSIDKTGALDATAHSPVQAGDVVNWTMTVTNTGNVDLTTVTVTDTTVTGLTCDATTLSKGASMQCTATSTLTQTDINAGTISNTATVDATDADGNPAPQGTSTADVPLPASPAIAIDKTVLLNGAQSDGGTLVGAAVGDSLSYTFVVTNTGNVTLTNVNVGDALAGVTLDPSCSNLGTLDPGQQATCTGSYTLTATDITG